MVIRSGNFVLFEKYLENIFFGNSKCVIFLLSWTFLIFSIARKKSHMKNFDVILKEYFQRLSDENLKFVTARFNQRYGGDLGEVLDFIGSSKDIDKWLQTAASHEDFYDMMEELAKIANQEAERRSSPATA